MTTTPTQKLERAAADGYQLDYWIYERSEAGKFARVAVIGSHAIARGMVGYLRSSWESNRREYLVLCVPLASIAEKANLWQLDCGVNAETLEQSPWRKGKELRKLNREAA